MTFDGSFLDLEPGSFICVVGRGESARIHRHTYVSRMTKTMFVTSRIVDGRVCESRFSLRDGRGVDASIVGAVRCQLKKS